MIEQPLEPPGSIAVIGAGPVGLEAALYGRFLGYEVTVFEAGRVAQGWRSRGEQPVPFSPPRGLSPLAHSAVQTQRDGAVPLPRTAPLTVGAWIEQSLEALAETDLLAGRVQTQCRVTAVAMAPADASDEGQLQTEADPGEADDDEVPPDLLLELVRADGSRETVRVEAVIDTTGGGDGESDLAFDVPDPEAFQRLGTEAEDGDFRTSVAYFYRLDAGDQATAAAVSLEVGWDRIRRLYAMLGERASLDLYRPLRQ